ncbi:MAG TPA: LEA type 2 family protein [Turneriella sp.]|nr:LEA type 2 family protein [Turneriella sp.]HNE20290.1 LEA type 2 family protein [Turneriella sp.]HNJ66951.1 LEA type 2 family protein [Turneriella sp.]HNL09572.1 LEA type 2 family protein [Turneriella sp.]HNL55453.1 LEA type 2 family protein [Turneriella sp.]
MLRRYRLFILSLLLLPLVSCALLQGRFSEFTPDIRLKEVNLRGFDFEGADLEYVYTIKNKIGFGITFSRLAFQIAVDGKRMVDVKNDKNVVIKANDSTEFTIVQRVRYVETVEAIFEFAKKDSVAIALTGAVGVYINELIGTIEVPIEASKTVPVPKLPQVHFGSLDFERMNLSNPLNPQATFTLRFNVRNPNPFEVKIPKVDYAFTAAGTNVISGARANQTLKPQADSLITVPVNLSGRNIVELVPKLRDLNSTDYRFTSAVEFAIMGQSVSLPFYYPK